MSNNSRILALVAMFSTTMATQSMAEFRYETKNGGHTLVYGQLSPAYLLFDDGASTTSEIVDNTNSNSRVGFWYKQPTDTGEFSVNFETSFGLRPSAFVSQIYVPDSLDWQRKNIRKVDAIWTSDRYGKFYLGQGSMSSDGASGKDLSGTSIVLQNSIPDTAAAFRFRTTAGFLSTITVAQAYSSFDGGRKARIRYDTPSFGGVRLSVSYGEEILAENVDQKVADFGLIYAKRVGSVKMSGALAYSRIEFETGVTRNDTVGSFSLLHDTGFNVTVAAGNRKETGNYVYGKLGYRANWFSTGTTALAVDYYAGSAMISTGSNSDSMGFGVVQAFDKANIQAYLGYRNYKLAETTATYQDASSVMFGARWKF